MKNNLFAIIFFIFIYILFNINLITSYVSPVCGNNICENEEDNWCPVCTKDPVHPCEAPCYKGSCPEDCKINSDCKNLYWIDNENKDCSQKEFCGSFMYLGLKTFETKGECEKNVKSEDILEDCLPGECENKLNNKTKTMPEVASDKAIERLGELGFNVELKYVGNQKNNYLFDFEKDTKILGLINKKAKIRVEYDTDSDEFKIKKPWWAFLAKGI